MTTISLHAFCKEFGLPKSSVFRRCKELGINTSDGLDKEACSRLLQEFGKAPVTPVDLPKDVSASAGAIAPIVHTTEVVPISTDLVARKIQPQVVGYDTTELDTATQLNKETLEYNVNAMGSQLIEQMKQLAKLHAAQARQAYAHQLATEINDMTLGK